MAFRNFVFTVFNDWAPLEPDWSKLSYGVWGKEVCPETGKKHWQGYAELKKQARMKGIKAIFGIENMHIEKRKGTAAQAAEYCKKDGEYVEDGTISKQGARKDITVMREAVAAGKSMREMVPMASSLQGIRTAEKLLSYLEQKRNWVTEVYWFWGPTGTGKTRTAVEMCEDPWISNRDLKWWEGYDAHADVIFDDFRGDFCTYHELLRILDRYPYRIEVKGGSRQLLAKRIIITSAYPPHEIYSTKEEIDQLLRRIKEVRYFEQDLDEVSQK